MAFPDRRCGATDAANDKPAMGRHAHFRTGLLLLIADQGFRRCHPVRALHFVGERNVVPTSCSLAAASSADPAADRAERPAVRAWDDMPDYAAFCALSGLPRLAGTRAATIPAPIPYLRADPGRITRWSDRLSGLMPSGYRRIGVIWAGRPTHNNDRNRSALLADFMPLASVAGLALLALQKGPTTGQAGGYYGRAPLINLGTEIDDYDDTMAILENLDLLVTVDTSVAHLAGAMGRPVWIMLPRAPDWRWLLGRSDTPWYPSMRLFRQQTTGQWDDVVKDIAANWQNIPGHRR